MYWALRVSVKCPRYTMAAWTDQHSGGMIESFGCHLSWPELVPVALEKHILSREGPILAAEEWDFSDRPTYYTAIRNLQGFIAFHLNENEEALNFFHDVLEKDKDNINALGNVALIYKKLYKMEENRNYRQDLERVFRKPSFEDRARAYADKAHAIRYFEQYKRGFRYMRFIERAATLGKKCSGPQRAEWFFDYALALYRRDVQMLYLRKLAREASDVPEFSECYSDERIKDCFLKACQFFLEVARTSTSLDYQALSWVFLGILVNHDPKRRSLPMAFPDDEEANCLSAEDCYEKGLDIRPDHAIVIRRVGSEYVKLGRFKEAKNLLDKSLAILESQFGYRHRAVMFLAMYEAASDEQRRTDQPREWLLEAVRDFKKALTMKEVHADLSDLGYVYFLLGETDKALVKFQQATENKQDDYFDKVETHRRWAQCLLRTNQLEGSHLLEEKAREVRSEILETPLEEDQTDHFSDDFEHYTTAKKQGFVRILEDNHFWSTKRRASELSPPDAQGRKQSGKMYRYDFFVWHAERDSRWSVAFLHKLESEHGFQGSIPRRDFEIGRVESTEIMRCLRESYKCVLILTSRPSIDNVDWSSFVINHAVMEGNLRGGEYIVPIMLRDCPVPDIIQTLTVRKCDEGQILKGHWDELVRKLTQKPLLSIS